MRHPKLPSTDSIHVLRRGGRLREAADLARRTTASDPANAEAAHLLGLLNAELGQFAQATRSLQNSIALAPSDQRYRKNAAAVAAGMRRLAQELAEHGRAEEAAEQFRHVAQLEPEALRAHSELLFAMQYSERISPAEALEEARGYGRRFEGMAFDPYENDRSPDRRLRVGYVSPDFRHHTISTVIEPVLRSHDRRQVEVFCYSAVRQLDDITVRLSSLSDHWIEITNLGDDEAATRIRADRIDILVDLTGHMGDSRLPVFARRPAPVQMQLAYAGTTGLAALDYKLSDPHLTPDGSDGDFSERLIRLPETAWVYQRPDGCPEVGSLPARSQGHITFGSLNNPAKISETAVRLWSEVLRAVPRSHLLLLSALPNPHLLGRFACHGIGSGRITLVRRCRASDYFTLFNQIDIALDPTPYNGDTTTCDALWMGVPVVTLAGSSMASRRGASILSNVGLNDWIAQTPEEYVAIAIRMGGHLEALASLRASLRERMRQSPLTDGPRYTRHLEAAYREIRSAWCGGRSCEL